MTRRALALSLGPLCAAIAGVLLLGRESARAVNETTKETVHVPLGVEGGTSTTFVVDVTIPDLMAPGVDTLGTAGHWELVSPDGGGAVAKWFVEAALDTSLSTPAPFLARLVTGDADTIITFYQGIFTHTQPPDSAAAQRVVEVSIRNTNPNATLRYLKRIWTK